MPQFNYKAINDAGKKVGGQITAANEYDLYQRLRDLRLELVDFREVKAKGGGLSFAQPIQTRDLIQLCMHLQQLQAAGVSLIEGLQDVRDSTDHRRLKDMLAEVYQDVAAGASLSEAFGRHPKTFGHVFKSLLSAGEESGNLTEAFDQLVKHLKWQEEITGRIKKATRYPSIMLVVIMIMFIVMMTFVVPEVVSFLTSSGIELPAITVALIATSEFVQGYWWSIPLVPVLLVVLYKGGRRTSDGLAYQMDKLILRLPKFGPLVRKISLSRFAHFFAVMFNSGVPILTCLDTAQKVVDNLCLQKSLESVRQSVQEGNPLSLGLKETGEFPSLVIRMVKIGEDSGNLSETLEHVTTFYDNDVRDSVDGLIAMIEPALTVFAGGLIVWIVAAVFGPIYDSFDQMGLGG